MTYSFTLLMKISKVDDPKAIGNQEQNIISVAEHFWQTLQKTTGNISDYFS